MKTISYKNVDITGGFFGERQQCNAQVTAGGVYARFAETGRFRALDCVRDDEHKSHIFWDSDVAKWLEGVAYILAKTEDAGLWARADAAIAAICRNQLPNGYFNSYFQVYEPENIFRKRTEHELYCAGHLIEAAVAFKESGADERLYAAMTKYADYIYERFYVRKDAGFFTCGHPEIELALIRLYEVSGQEKYLRLAEYFVETRGRHKETMYDFDDPACAQDDAPVRELRKARGHAVRALYLYTAMADLARIRQDETLAAACETLFRDIVDTKMYLTGGTGSSHYGERFTFAYHLPDFSAYSETCAGIALALFCDRLAKRKNRAEYHEIFERVLYNVVSAGIGRDGKSFFYVNPLEMHAAYVDYNDSLAVPQACPLPERVEVFDCSCCPPNLLRFFASLSGYLYGEEGGVVYVNQYVTSRTEAAGAKIEVVSELPYSGRVRIAVSGRVGLRLRVPAWHTSVRLRVGGADRAPDSTDGYIAVDCAGETEIELDFGMRARFVWANERVWHDSGRKAVEYGPLVLCAESADNGPDLASVRIPDLKEAAIDRRDPFTLAVPAERLRTSPALYSYEAPVAEPFTLRLIPYFAWANRGRGDMQVWFL